jgi:hypothetical protein
VVLILTLITLLASFSLALIFNSSEDDTSAAKVLSMSLSSYSSNSDIKTLQARGSFHDATPRPTYTGSKPPPLTSVAEIDATCEGKMDVDVETDAKPYTRVEAEIWGTNGVTNEGLKNESGKDVGNADVNDDMDIATDPEIDLSEPTPPKRNISDNIIPSSLDDAVASNVLSPSEPPLSPDSTTGVPEASEKLEDNAFHLELSRLKLDVSEWCSSWGGVDKFAGYIQLEFYGAIMKDDIIYRYGIDEDDGMRDTEPPQPVPPFSIGYFFKRWNKDMMEKVGEGERLLSRAKFLGGGKVSWVTSGGKDTSVLQMSWWKYHFLWAETTAVVQELSRGMGKIDATCQLLVNHPDFDFRPSFTWRPPYRPPYNSFYNLPSEDKATSHSRSSSVISVY